MPLVPIEWLPPLMFAVLVLFMLTGFPVAFALAANGLLFGWVAIEQGLMNPALIQAIPDRIFGIMTNDTLLAIPFFTLMGILLEKSGMAEELLESMGQLFGRVRGGLVFAVVLVGALLAATTGVVAASVISMGLISLPIMLKHGYNQPLATGAIMASGTLAQIIPPSLVLIVMADQLGVSVGDMYQGALLPGLLLTALYLVFLGAASALNSKLFPALQMPSSQGQSPIQATLKLLWVLAPPLTLIFLVLGTIFVGIATPTEGGAMGALGALALTAAKGRLNMTLLKSALDNTTKVSSFVMFILIGSTVFGLTFRALEGDTWVEDLLTSLPGGELGFLLAVNLLVFTLGGFLDFFEIAFIVIPLLVPVAQALNIDLVWFGVVLAINMQTSFLTPPFGFALFYLKSVVPPSVQTTQLYKGAVPFIVLQLLMVALVMAFPQLVWRDKPVTFEDKPLELEIPGEGYGK